jgi:hypothetical protein
MNKKMYFALAATAGLFASCSSDNLSENQTARLATIDENAPAKIELSVGSMGSSVETRGTGSVGVDGLGNTGFGWAGQKFNVFMLNKGTMKYAHMIYGDNTSDFVLADDPTDATAVTGLGAEYTAPNQGGTSGTDPAGLTTGLEVYYPTEGVYDFWAYRLDDAYKGVAVEGANDENADAIKIPFTIDGSQDVMTAAVSPSAEYDEASMADKLYSAYTGRRNVKAMLDFKHQLTRLTFKVKANSIEVSENATPVPGAPTYNGFMVTGISVHSNTTGKLVAAYKPTYDVSAGVIEWNAADWAPAAPGEAPAALTALQLKSRAYGVNTAEAGTWFEIPTTAVIGATISGAHVPTTINANLKVYLTKDQNPTTKVPTGTSMTFSDWQATTPTVSAWYWDQTTAYVPDPANVNVNDNLQELTPVHPKWEITTNAVHAETTLYTITGTETTVADAAALTAAAAELTTLGDNVFYVTGDTKYVNVNVTAACTGVGNADAVYTTTDLYDVTGSEVAVADDAALTTTQNAANATGTTVFFVGGTKYVSSAVTAKAIAEGTPTAVGEAIMAAPADANGYFVTVTYNYWKKDNATTSHEVVGAQVKKQIILKNKTGVQTAQPWKPGKQYNITIELYKNGTADTSTKVSDWEDDTENELEDSYDFE